MTILVTNDDGIHAEGLEVLVERLSREHEVWAIAPDRERSGMSHAVTLHDSVTIQELTERRYRCSGTPADCVLYALLGAVPCKPDLVVSGINHGANIGTDIIYSGTVAAARQAALMDVPGVAVSLLLNGGIPDFAVPAGFVAAHSETFKELWESDFFFNINLPSGAGNDAPVEITKPALRIYNDTLTAKSGPSGTVYKLQGTVNGAHIAEGTDWSAVENGSVSVSPILLHPLNQSKKESYHAKRFEIGAAGGL
jgi:5'-nucleotidase